MPDDPIIVAKGVVLDNGTERLRDRLFDELWGRWLLGLAATIVSLVWMIIRTSVGHEPELPDRPLTKADVPLIEKKIKYLRKDAETVGSVFPHLRNKEEIKAAQSALEEVFYTPDVFPPAEQLHNIQIARIAQVRPDLATALQSRQKYEEARYAIANDPAITDKAAAIDALKKRTDPAAIGSEYSKTADQVTDVIAEFVGDPEFDQAKQTFHNAAETAILKRHPELGGFYHDFDNRDEAYHHFMAQANKLAVKVKELEGEPVPAASSALADSGTRHGVKVGDTVEISAVNPVVAAHNAVVTEMNDDQVKVRVGSDTFAIRWENVDRIKAVRK